LPSESPINVLVPVDGAGPYQIGDSEGHIRIVPTADRLEVRVLKANYENLLCAMVAGVKILEWLPETPVTAAGFNVNFQTDALEPDMAHLYKSAVVDSALARLGQSITRWQIMRSLDYKGGTLNVTIEGTVRLFELLCNFHKRSREIKDLICWLKTPAVAIRGQINSICESMNLELEEIVDADAE